MSPLPQRRQPHRTSLQPHATAAWSLALTAVLLLTACGKPEAQPGGGGGKPPAPEVGVLTVQPGEIGLITELPGRLEASRVAQVRARAAGILQKRVFNEGSDVKAGQNEARRDI